MIRFWLFIRVALLKIRNEHLKHRCANLERSLEAYTKALEHERREHYQTIRAAFGKKRTETGVRVTTANGEVYGGIDEEIERAAKRRRQAQGFE